MVRADPLNSPATANTPTGTPAPSFGPQPPSLLTMIAALCAAVVLGAVVWSTYAAFGSHVFDLRQAVMGSVRDVAAPRPVAQGQTPHVATPATGGTQPTTRTRG